MVDRDPLVQLRNLLEEAQGELLELQDTIGSALIRLAELELRRRQTADVEDA